MQCWLKLNGQIKWLAAIANSVKTAMLNEEKGVDQRCASYWKKMVRNQKKWEEEKESEKDDINNHGDGLPPAKKMETFEVIMGKEEACVTHNEVRKRKKAKRFGIFERRRRRSTLKRRRPSSKSRRLRLQLLRRISKCWPWRWRECMTMQGWSCKPSVFRMLKRLKDQAEMTKKEATEKEVDGKGEATTTRTACPTDYQTEILL